jgi:hypothetical protein
MVDIVGLSIGSISLSARSITWAYVSSQANYRHNTQAVTVHAELRHLASLSVTTHLVVSGAL